MSESKPKVSPTSITDKTFEVTLKQPFSDKYGDITGFVIIVSTNPAPNNNTATFDKWAEASLRTPMGTFQVIDKCSDLFSEGSPCHQKGTKRSKRAINNPDSGTEIKFVLGAEECDKNNRNDYCNGPLKAQTDYYVMLRGYTEEGRYSDTPYSEPIHTGS